MLAATLWWMTLRREGGSFNKPLAITATLGFVFSLRMLKVV